MSAEIEAPVQTAGLLICGLPRSGTSLTRSLIGSHPAFAVPRKEMGWWVTLYPRYRTRTARSWPQFLRDLLDAGSTRTLDLDHGTLERRLERQVPPGSHLHAFALVLSAFAQHRNRRRWGEKTLLAEFYADDVLSGLPGSQVIHVVRDPRDMFASYRHAAWRVPDAGPRVRASASLRGTMAWTLRNWSKSVQLARANAARHPDRYLVLRYEDLVADPRRELERVCRFAGEPFDPQMLEMRAYPDVLARGGNSSFGPLEGISPTPVGRFTTLLDAREIALCEALAGTELERNGYASAKVPLGPADALQLYALDRPWSALIGAVHAQTFRLGGIPRA